MKGDEELVREAWEMVRAARRKNPILMGWKTSGLLAGAYYLLRLREGDPVNMMDIARRFGVHKVTVRKAKDALIQVFGLQDEPLIKAWFKRWKRIYGVR